MRKLFSSDPSSPHHGKHMTPEEVIDFFAPDQSSVDAVIDWLVASGISRNRIGQSANKQVSAGPPTWLWTASANIGASPRMHARVAMYRSWRPIRIQS